MDIELLKTQAARSNKLKFYCDSVFDQKLSKRVYDFYRKTLTIDGFLTKKEYDTKNRVLRKAYESSSDKQVKHLKNLVDTYGVENIVAAMDEFEFKYKVGELMSTSMNYFSGFVKNQAKKDKKQEKVVEAPANTRYAVIPQQFGGNTTMTKASKRSDHLYWLWKCSCSYVLNTIENKCPQCNVDLDWENVKIDPFWDVNN